MASADPHASPLEACPKPCSGPGGQEVLPPKLTHQAQGPGMPTGGAGAPPANRSCRWVAPASPRARAAWRQLPKAPAP